VPLFVKNAFFSKSPGTRPHSLFASLDWTS
jgi:hypothetical protein